MENETKIERGQVYYLRENNSVGHEMAVGRPVLVVSEANNIEKSGVAVCVYMTSQPKSAPGVVKILVNGRANYILCNQFVTLDVSRLNTFMYDMDSSAMKRVNGALAYVLSLQGEIHPDKKQETEVTEKVDDNIALRVELELYQKLYQKAISDLVEVSHNYNVLKLESERVVEIPEASPVIVEETPKIEVNTEALKAKMMGGEIVDPVDREEDIPQKLRKVYGGNKVDRGLTPEEIDELLISAGMQPVSNMPRNKSNVGRAKLSPDAKPTNVNTATEEDFLAMGMGTKLARDIVRYRKKHGKFTCFDELLKVKGVGRGVIATFGSMWRL